MGGSRTATRFGRCAHNLLTYVALPIVLALAGCGSSGNQTAGFTQSSVFAHMVGDGDWPMRGRSFDGAWFSPLSDINTRNIKQLGLAWEFSDFVVRGRTHRGVEASPVLVDGVLYFSGPWGVAYAVDARTGKHIWTFDSEADGQYARNACCDAVSRGVVVHDGKVYVASLDGYLFALNAKTGEKLWKVDTFYDRHWNYSITGAPVMAGHNILIGNGGGEMGTRGYVSAYDADSGKLAWRFWAVPGDPKAGPDEGPEVTLARKTWPQDTPWNLGLGGNAWDSMAYDPDTNTAYLGLGNGDPHPQWLRSESGEVRNNLFLTSIVAVDANTGRLKWYYQTTPDDSWDYDATQPMVLADLEIAGRLRKVIMQAPKNGFFYVLDRVTGELLSAKPYTKVNWADGVDMKTGRPGLTRQADYRHGPRIVFPSMAGGHAWQPMAFSPRTGLVYLPVYEAPMRIESKKSVRFMPGTINQGSLMQLPPFEKAELPAQMKGEPQPKLESRLKAWDPVTQTARWVSAPLPFVSSGTLVAGDLVFQGSTNGYLYAYDAQNGHLLRKLFVGTAMLAPPITYRLDGVQYVALLAGMGGPQGTFWAPDVVARAYENYERLLVFKLGGGAIPLPPRRKADVVEPVPARIAATPATLARGRSLFEVNCQRCHWMGGASSNYPNLWNMPPEIHAQFNAVVSGGAFRYAGMANFSDVLSRADVEAIHAFIVDDTIAKRRDGADAGAHSNLTAH